jgi:hypothetical protein
MKTTLFKTQCDYCEMFYARGDLLRQKFGLRDALDPVAHAILDLVEAQHELADAYSDDAECGLKVDFKAAVEKRHAAGKRLMQALEDRASWPDPTLGFE